MISDSHLHTAFSTDSKAKPEEVIEAAIRAGMTNLCITDHYDPEYPTGEFMIDIDAYWNELSRLREIYKDQIALRIGIEIGLLPHLHDEVLRIANAAPFDFIIGSVHIIDGIDPYERDAFHGTDDEMYHRYFQVALEDLQATEGYQSFGHLDYIVRYGYEKDAHYSYEKFQSDIDPILREIIRKHIALEINTGALTRGMHQPNPHPDIIRRYRELGGELFTLGSDAHNAAVGSGFDQVIPMLRRLGVTEITEYWGGELRKVELVSQ
jgi:histidinol-phosphatase (PHP family)